MGALPPLRSLKRRRETIMGFAGYNHNPMINDREMYDMRNMQSGLLPVLAPRQPRARVRTLARPNGLFAHEDKLCWVDGTAFWFDGANKGEVQDGDKTFVRMGAYVLIWPDKCYYNTQDDEFGSMEAQTVTQGTVTASLCRSDGVLYDYVASDTAPEDPPNGQYWVDTSDVAHVLKLYSAETGLWGSIATVYVKIECAGIGKAFKADDGVSIEGFAQENLNGEKYLVDSSEDAVIVVGVLDANVTQEEPVTIRRKVPDLDFMTECNNRIWGCNSEKHEIYACKLGDPMNWHTYRGIATDSYTVTVGSGGAFTGCCSYMGYPLFFKENAIYKIFGTRPANYQMDESLVRGVAAGSGRSIATVNEQLLYRAAEDVCAYGGSVPSSVSGALGAVGYRNAVGGALGERYYISMQGEKGWALFVYDTRRGCWVREDDTHALYMASCGGDLYYINAEDNGLYSVRGNKVRYADETAAQEPPYVWSVETGDIGLTAPDGKYVSGIQLFLEADAAAHLRVQLRYDAQPWEDVYAASGERVSEANRGTEIGQSPMNAEARDLGGGPEHETEYLLYFASGETISTIPVKRAFTLPIHTPRCNTLRMRLSGVGEVRLYSITRTVEQGSDRDGI